MNVLQLLDHVETTKVNPQPSTFRPHHQRIATKLTMVVPSYTCTNPACDEDNESSPTHQAASNSNSSTKNNSCQTINKCELMEKCASSCAAYSSPTHQATSNSNNTKNNSCQTINKCELMEKCASSCAAYSAPTHQAASNNSNSSTKNNSCQTINKCELMEKCASSCAAYGRVCPCAARAAGRAACRAADKLYMGESNIFKEKAEYEHLDANDLLIQEKLGEGGFSLVHRVTLKAGKEKGQDFAVKYLKRKIMVDQRSFELGAADLAVEANFLAKMDHKNIVKLHGVTAGSVETNVATGKECGFFIIIDLLPETLEKKIEMWRETAEQGNLLTRMSHDFKERRRLALMDRLKIAIELADAMIYLHSRSIIYRDLKPDNIGFDVNGTLKLFGKLKCLFFSKHAFSTLCMFHSFFTTDFGLAKELKEKHLNGTYKLSGNTGSRRYMAPEVAKEKHYGLPVDVFSFGILLHELTSLEKPFLGYSAKKHMMQVVMGGERPRLDTSSTSWFPMELHWLLKKCWSTDPSERPSFHVLKKVLEDLVHATPKSPGKFRRPRTDSTGGNNHQASTGAKHPLSSLPNRPKSSKSMDTNEVPDFRKMKPLPKPTKQTKSLGFLRRNQVTQQALTS